MKQLSSQPELEEQSSDGWWNW